MADQAPHHKRVIRLFGSLEIETDDGLLGPRDLGGSRPKQVLEILLAARGHPVATDRLARLLWADESPVNAAGSLQTFISVLRRRLAWDGARGRDLLVTEREAYRFRTDLVDLDLDRFDQLVAQARHESPREARRLLDMALTLVRGEVLEDEPYSVWADDVRRSYEQRVRDARLASADLALGEFDYSAALTHADEVVLLDPFNERAHRTAMLSSYALGRQHDALERYRRLRTALDEELGIQPTIATRALESAILRQEDLHLLVPRPAEPERSSAKSGSIRLLGRQSEIQTIKDAIAQPRDGAFRLLLLEGEAGAGKTRLLDEIAADPGPFRVGRARASALEQHLPYVPLAAALRRAVPAQELKARRHDALGTILPELRSGGGPREVADLDALEALRELFDRHAPLILLLDDLQWADAHSVAAISYLQHRCASTSVVVVAAVRPEETAAHHPVRRLTPDAVIRLDPLTRADLEPLGIPGLYESTGGNPRLITETVLNGHGAKHPSPLAEALLAECRSQGVWAYRVLLAASLLDQPFEPEVLAHLLHVDDAELTEELERLCERRLLQVAGLRFRFRYDLVRNVLIASLSPARRRLLQARLHRAVGRVRPLTATAEPYGGVESGEGAPDQKLGQVR